MENVRLFLICMLILSNAFDNTKGEPKFSEEHLLRESPRRLEVSDEDYIIVEYSTNFTNLKGFESKNPEINKASIYFDNDTIITEIKPGSKIKIKFNTPLTTLEYLFYNMTKIKSIDFSHFNSTEIYHNLIQN